jgi:hypothetical protein
MRSGQFLLSSALLLLVSMPCLAKTYNRRGPTSHRLHKLHFRHTKSATRKPLGQRAIDDGRATQIQTALIKSGYLSGQASGHWDGATESAMQKFQADNGWQTKLTPDSRAIIKLGLGPSHTSELTAASSSNLAASTPSAGSEFVQK